MGEPTAEEIADAVRARLGTAVAQFRGELSHIESMLKAQPRQVAPASAAGRRIRSLGTGTVAIQAPPVPTPGPGATLEALVASLVANGIKQRSYDEVDDVIAPNNITPTGDSYDAGVLWDHWIVVPTIDSLISFKGAPSQNTPILSAGLSMNFQIRASKVWYQAAPGVSGPGQLYVRLARYVDAPGG